MSLRFPEDVHARLVRTWPEWRSRELRGEANWPRRVALGVPTESEAAAAIDAFRDWTRAWSRGLEGARVEWGERTWSRLGRQRVPEHLVIENPIEHAAVVGAAAEWRRVSARGRSLAERWPGASFDSLLAAAYDGIAALPDPEFALLVNVAGWLAEPRARALHPREIPVPGAHTKWFERHAALVALCVAAIRGVEARGDPLEICGLRLPSRAIRLRLPCATLRATLGGLADLEAPAEQVACLPLRPRGLLIVENVVSAQALTDLSGIAVVAGLGAAVAPLESLQWAKDCAWGYWGDLDTHGLAILDAVRGVRASTTALLMDEETLLRHRALWVVEPIPSTRTLTRLGALEQDLYHGLRAHRWGDRVRLEQERLPWDYALRAIDRWARSV